MTPPAIRSVIASDSCPLHFRHWPATHPRGLIVATHGIQSHSGWYEYSSARLATAGFDVYFADRRGSGLNAEPRGHADHGLRLVNDLRQLMHLARREHQPSGGRGTGLPLTLMGLSWGGKTAAATAAVAPREVDRLALLYPGLAPRLCPNCWQWLRLKFARYFDVRHAMVSVPLQDPALFTGSPEWQRFIVEDRLALHSVTSGFLNAGRDLDRLWARHAHAVTQPTLLMLAGRDRIIDNQRTRARVAMSGILHLTTIVYPDACHTLEFEPDREVIVDDLIDWLTNVRGSGRGFVRAS